MITNTRTPQDCCKGCRWLHYDYPDKNYCNLRVKAMFTPDCAFSPEREAERKHRAISAQRTHEIATSGSWNETY